MGSSTHRRVALAVLATVLLCKAVPGRGMTECELELAGTQERLRKAELKIASQTRELAGEEEPELATLAAASEDGSLDVKTPTDIAAAAAFHVDALLESQTGDPHNFNDKKDDEDLPGRSVGPCLHPPLPTYTSPLARGNLQSSRPCPNAKHTATG